MNPCRFKLFLIDARHIIDYGTMPGLMRKEERYTFSFRCAFLKDNFLFDLIHVRST